MTSAPWQVKWLTLSNSLWYHQGIFLKKVTVQDVPQAKTFQSKGRQSTVSPEELSDQWQIGLEQAIDIATKTTQRLTWSAVMPLASRYKADRVFQSKSLTDMWATDTMDGRVKSFDGNQYAQLFSNRTYFSEIYPMARRAESGQALNTFVMELSAPEELKVDESKEQNSPGTEFMNPNLCPLHYFMNLIYSPYPL